MRYTAFLVRRGAQPLVAAHALTQVANRVHRVALAWLVFAATGDLRLVAVAITVDVVAKFGAAGLATATPRWNAARGLAASSAVRALAAMAVLVVPDGAVVATAIAVAAVNGAMEGVFTADRQAVLTGSFDGEALATGRSLGKTVRDFTRPLYVVGGAVVVVAGARPAYAVYAGVLLAAAAAAVRLPGSSGERDTGPAGQAVRDWLTERHTALRVLRATPTLVRVLAFTAVLGLTTGFLTMATLVAGDGPWLFGAFYGAYHAGSVVGGLVATVSRPFLPDLRITLAALTSGVGLAVVAVAATLQGVPPTVTALALGACGAAVGAVQVLVPTAIRSLASDEIAAVAIRFGTRAAMYTTVPAGVLGAGLLFVRFDPFPVLIGLGLSTVAVALVAAGIGLRGLPSMDPRGPTG